MSQWMSRGTWAVAGAICLGLNAGTALAQRALTATEAETDHRIVYELGPAMEWSRAEGTHLGATAAFEITPIENWLELEFGITGIRSNGSIETTVDGLMKKPWSFSRSFEFMLGAGPEVVRSAGATHGGVGAVLDFMFWPRANVGWYLEPGVDAVFANGGTKRSLGMAMGLLIGR